MIHTYKITGKNEWKNFNSILVYAIGFVLGYPIMFYARHPEGDMWEAVHFPAIGFLLFFIPLCLIHYKYLSLNDGMEMTYDDAAGKIVIKNSKLNTSSEFGLEDIKLVSHTMTVPMMEKRMHWFPWDSYNYSEILLKNGEKHMITSLMVYRLALPIGDKYQIAFTPIRTSISEIVK